MWQQEMSQESWPAVGQTMQGLAERSSVMTKKMLLESTINKSLMTTRGVIQSSVVERSQIGCRS